MNFICPSCAQAADLVVGPKVTASTARRARDRIHAQCPGGTWCDCQHGARCG